MSNAVTEANRILVISLIRSAGTLTLDELMHELTVLRRTCCIEFPPVTRTLVSELLGELKRSGVLDQTHDGTWMRVRMGEVVKCQSLLFPERI